MWNTPCTRASLRSTHARMRHRIHTRTRTRTFSHISLLQDTHAPATNQWISKDTSHQHTCDRYACTRVCLLRLRVQRFLVHSHFFRFPFPPLSLSSDTVGECKKIIYESFKGVPASLPHLKGYYDAMCALIVFFLEGGEERGRGR